MIAHLWKTSYGWKLEISEGSMPGNFRVISEHIYATKTEAKRAAMMAGAHPWNY